MTRLNALIVLFVAFSSVCFGATLMHRTMVRPINTEEHVEPSKIQVSHQDCSVIALDIGTKPIIQVIRELYKKAYRLSFKGDWEGARAASACAARLDNGSEHWAIEAQNLFSFLH
jgi:hypothetical protein